MPWFGLLAGALYACFVTAVQLHRHGGFYQYSLTHLNYGFGSLIQSLQQTGRYGVSHHGIEFVAHRLPFIPLLLVGLSSLLNSFQAVWLAKNLLFFGLSTWVCLLIIRERKPEKLTVAVVLGVLLLVPLSAYTLSALDGEEAYLGHLIFISFGLLALRQSLGRMLLQGSVIAAIVLTKSSTLPLAVVLASLACVRAFGTAPTRPWSWTPVAAVLAAVMSWGGFVDSQTGHFAWGPSASSYNGLNLEKGNNPLALTMYPRQYLDDIPSSYLAPDWSLIRNEWDFNAFHEQRAQAFINQHPGDFWKLVERKVEVAFLEVGKMGLQPNDAPGIDFAMLVLRPFLLLGIGVAAVRIVRNASRKALRASQADAAYLLCIAAYLAPFLIGFVYYRHLIPVATLTGAYFLTTVRRLTPTGKEPTEELQLAH